MQNGDIKLSRGAGFLAGWEEMLSLIWLAPTSSGGQMERFDIITEQLKLIECNYTVEIHRQCRPQRGPRSHAMCITGCQAHGTSAHLVCQLDSWVTGVKCGSEAQADWTFWVGASYIKKISSRTGKLLSLRVSHTLPWVLKWSFSAGVYQPPAGSLTASSAARWHTVHTWAHRVGSHGAAGCGKPANSETVVKFERLK